MLSVQQQANFNSAKKKTSQRQTAVPEHLQAVLELQLVMQIEEMFLAGHTMLFLDLKKKKGGYFQFNKRKSTSRWLRRSCEE